MMTKYSTMSGDIVREYFDRLVGKIYKLLPLKEEGNATLNKYHTALMVELTGASHLFNSLEDRSEFVSMICSLEGLSVTDDMEVYKRKVFECINIAKKIK